MAILNVNPTRMQLSILRSRLETATRGHKLMKDKQDELVRRFIEMIRTNRELRQKVEEELINSFKDFTQASSSTNDDFIELALSMPKQKVSLNMELESVMNVLIPNMEFSKENIVDLDDGRHSSSIFPYGFSQTNPDLDLAIIRLNKILDMLLELAEIEKSTQLMADEIEQTRRRVNALEHKTIPDLEDTIKHIRMKLDENERATITRLMKTKDLIAEADAKAEKKKLETVEAEQK